MAVVASGRGPAATAVCGRFRGNRPGVSVEAHAAASPLISGLAGRRSFRRWQSETCADTADDPLAISNAMTISCTFLSGTWMPPCPRCPQPAYGPCGQNSTSARRFIVVSSGPDAVGRRPYVSDGLASSPWSDSAPPTSLATSHSSRPACCSSCPVPLKWPDHQPLTWLDQIEWHAGAPGNWCSLRLERELDQQANLDGARSTSDGKGHQSRLGCRVPAGRCSNSLRAAPIYVAPLAPCSAATAGDLLGRAAARTRTRGRHGGVAAAVDWALATLAPDQWVLGWPAARHRRVGSR